MYTWVLYREISQPVSAQCNEVADWCFFLFSPIQPSLAFVLSAWLTSTIYAVVSCLILQLWRVFFPRVCVEDYIQKRQLTEKRDRERVCVWVIIHVCLWVLKGDKGMQENATGDVDTLKCLIYTHLQICLSMASPVRSVTPGLTAGYLHTRVANGWPGMMSLTGAGP